MTFFPDCSCYGDDDLFCRPAAPAAAPSIRLTRTSSKSSAVQDGAACSKCDQEKSVSREAKRKLAEAEAKMKAESERVTKEIMELTAKLVAQTEKTDKASRAGLERAKKAEADVKKESAWRKKAEDRAAKAEADLKKLRDDLEARDAKVASLESLVAERDQSVNDLKKEVDMYNDMLFQQELNRWNTSSDDLDVPATPQEDERATPRGGGDDPSEVDPNDTTMEVNPALEGGDDDEDEVGDEQDLLNFLNEVLSTPVALKHVIDSLAKKADEEVTDEVTPTDAYELPHMTTTLLRQLRATSKTYWSSQFSAESASNLSELVIKASHVTTMKRYVCVAHRVPFVSTAAILDFFVVTNADEVHSLFRMLIYLVKGSDATNIVHKMVHFLLSRELRARCFLALRDIKSESSSQVLPPPLVTMMAQTVSILNKETIEGKKITLEGFHRNLRETLKSERANQAGYLLRVAREMREQNLAVDEELVSALEEEDGEGQA